jgi:hypothetical protein
MFLKWYQKLHVINSKKYYFYGCKNNLRLTSYGECLGRVRGTTANGKGDKRGKCSVNMINAHYVHI